VGYCAYNVFSTLGAALRSAHGSETIDRGLSKHAVVFELKAMGGGLGVMVPEEQMTIGVATRAPSSTKCENQYRDGCSCSVVCSVSRSSL
jgi:hypothetical protein